jgi:hypothetical protein
MKKIWIFAALACLPACVAAWGNSYNVESKDKNSIVIKYDPVLATIRTVWPVAEVHCGQFEKDAVPENVETSGWSITTASFSCRHLSVSDRKKFSLILKQQEARDLNRKASAIALMDSASQSYHPASAPNYDFPSVKSYRPVSQTQIPANNLSTWSENMQKHQPQNSLGSGVPRYKVGIVPYSDFNFPANPAGQPLGQ